MANQDKTVITMPDDIKNAAGDLGPVCNNCAGFGFTYSLGGGTLNCSQCQKTGVKDVDVKDLQRQVIELTRLVKKLYSEMQKKGITEVI